jgi:hypothetical protein
MSNSLWSPSANITEIVYTFLSWPALANNFPSDEKWQHTTLLVLARRQPTSLNENPIMTNTTLNYGQNVYKTNQYFQLKHFQLTGMSHQQFSTVPS